MGIKGFQGTSLLDFPGKIAALVFFGGCNLSCPFCHNPSLVLGPDELPDYPASALLDDLRERRSFIDGVVVTGGEPTVNPELIPLLRQLKALGLLVKLDTNGLAPGILGQVLEEGLVDYLALDLKTAPDRYPEMHSAPVNAGQLAESVRLILGGDVDYEVRTTCVPGYVEEADIRRIGELIRGARRWVLQQYAPGHALDEALQRLDPHSPARLHALARLAENYARVVSVRGLMGA